LSQYDRTRTSLPWLMGMTGSDVIMRGDELQSKPSIILRRKAHMAFQPLCSLYFGMFSSSASC
jgi:hypothetical protein